MSELKVSDHARLANEHQETDQRNIFGVWLYLMTDGILFACLFAVYAVLHSHTFGGPGGAQLFEPHIVLIETLVLLTSSFTCGLVVLTAKQRNKKLAITWLAITGALGLIFLGIEIQEFAGLISSGNGWSRNAFTSSFFTLVGTHGVHITVGLMWLIAMIVKIYKVGFNRNTRRRLVMFSYFWHFLDIVWIFIFTAVYLLGVS